MKGFLLDTNVLSETSRQKPHSAVYRFISECPDLWVPVIVIDEVQRGLDLLPHGRKRDRLSDWLAKTLVAFENRFLAVGLREAHWSGKFRAHAKHIGYQMTHGDALIAATAASNELCLATRNVKDFDFLGIDILNPWEQP